VQLGNERGEGAGSTNLRARLDWVGSKTNGKTVIRKSFALTLIAGLFMALPLRAEPDSKNKSGQRPKTERKQSTSSSGEKDVNRVLTVRDITIFTYQPAPTRPIDSRKLRDEGLVRVSINQQGVVTAVKITRSTGNRDFDTDAVEAFRRWRTRPGPAREIDLPITAVTTGKKAPVRIPLGTGNMTIG
jgi:TonB family protein